MPRHYHAAITRSDFSELAKLVSESFPTAARWGLRNAHYLARRDGLTVTRTNYDEFRTVVRTCSGKSECVIRTKTRRHYGSRKDYRTQYELSVWHCYGDCLERAVAVG